MTHQEAHFRNALKEAGMKSNSVRVNHHKGTCHANGIDYPLIWPKSFVAKCIELHKDKRDFKFAFMGNIAATGDIGRDRKWVYEYDNREYSAIVPTTNGRRIVKGSFDKKYFTLLGNTSYALCPKGEVPWTYRFLEAAFMKCIPVLNKGQSDTNANIIDFCFHGNIDSKIDVEENFRKVVQKHTL